MILLTIFILIILYSINFLRNSINSVLFRRISAISFIYASVLTINTLYIQSIGYGIGLYGGLFQINIITNFTSIFLLFISSIIILSWPNINYSYVESFTRYALALNNLHLYRKPLMERASMLLQMKRDGVFLLSMSQGLPLRLKGVEWRSPTDNNNTKESELLNITGVRHTGEEEYSILILFSLLGALFLISSSDLLSFYLSIELQSFGVYILASLYRDKISSTSAGLKYFLLGGLSSCLILLGSGVIYSYTGLTNFESIYDFLSIISFKSLNETLSNINSLFIASSSTFDELLSSVDLLVPNSNVIIDPLRATNKISSDVLFGLTLGFIFIISGFLFKIAAAPFHNWSPDVYDDCPTIVTIWLTIMPKISILIFILSLIIGLDIELPHSELVGEWILPGLINTNLITSLLLLSSLLSLIIGAVLGLNQIRIKRLLA